MRYGVETNGRDVCLSPGVLARRPQRLQGIPEHVAVWPLIGLAFRVFLAIAPESVLRDRFFDSLGSLGSLATLDSVVAASSTRR